MNETNLQVLLRARPTALPTPANFALSETEAATPGPGEVLVRHRFLSLDPYMRGRMDESRSYAPSVALGAVMEGECVGQVVASASAAFAPGDWVAGARGWQRFSVAAPAALRKLDPDAAPVTTALGVLGMPGATAWHGCTEICRPRPGETFVVSAASGAVGSVAGQIARAMGARVVGIAGGAEKCAFVVEQLGFDACIDHRAEDFALALAAACPQGVDAYFDNVGGLVQHTVWPLLNEFARMALCGAVADTSKGTPPAGPPLGLMVRRRLTLQGFIIFDHPRAFPAWRATGARWISEGKLKYREDIVQGLAQAPEAFIGLLQGRNFGKLIVAID